MEVVTSQVNGCLALALNYRAFKKTMWRVPHIRIILAVKPHHCDQCKYKLLQFCGCTLISLFLDLFLIRGFHIKGNR